MTPPITLFQANVYVELAADSESKYKMTNAKMLSALKLNEEDPHLKLPDLYYQKFQRYLSTLDEYYFSCLI